jgi:RHS repeat-associated protein
MMTNSAGTTVWKADYEPFGKTTVTVSTITNNVRLAGQYFDSETGLHYNNARYYDPKVGRYITADPVGVIPGVGNSPAVPEYITKHMQSVPLNTRLQHGLNHPYVYALNNPMRFTDASGLSPNVCTSSPDIYPEACRRHDECYRNACKTRWQCDSDFFWDALFESGPWPNVFVPGVYWIGVRVGGGPFYDTP